MIVELYIVTKEYKKQLVDYCNLLAPFSLSHFPFITASPLPVFSHRIHIYYHFPIPPLFFPLFSYKPKLELFQIQFNPSLLILSLFFFFPSSFLLLFMPPRSTPLLLLPFPDRSLHSLFSRTCKRFWRWIDHFQGRSQVYTLANPRSTTPILYSQKSSGKGTPRNLAGGLRLFTDLVCKKLRTEGSICSNDVFAKP